MRRPSSMGTKRAKAPAAAASRRSGGNNSGEEEEPVVDLSLNSTAIDLRIRLEPDCSTNER
jgi:hypothetical protein